MEIEAARVKSKLNKGEVCEKAKVHNAAYSRMIASGEANLPFCLISLNKIRKALGLSQIAEQRIFLIPAA